jgi:hypothetical protein
MPSALRAAADAYGPRPCSAELNCVVVWSTRRILRLGLFNRVASANAAIHVWPMVALNVALTAFDGFCIVRLVRGRHDSRSSRWSRSSRPRNIYGTSYTASALTSSTSIRGSLRTSNAVTLARLSQVELVPARSEPSATRVVGNVAASSRSCAQPSGMDRTTSRVRHGRWIGAAGNNPGWWTAGRVSRGAAQRARGEAKTGGADPALDPDRARLCSRLAWLRANDCIGRTTAPLHSSSTVVSGRVRLARSDVDRVLDTGAGCRRASDQVGCVLPVVR